MFFVNPLRTFCGVGIAACMITAGNMYFKQKIEEKIGNQDLCKKCVQEMVQHNSSIEALGHPLKYQRPNLRKTTITETEATICIPVSGSTTAGEFLINASKQQSDPTWIVQSLKLKLSDTEVTLR